MTRYGCMDCGAAWTARTTHDLACPDCGSGVTFPDGDDPVETTGLAGLFDDPERITAGADITASLSVSFFDDPITASATTRTLSGIGVRYGVYGRTSKGRLKVRDINALRYPADLSRVILTREHDRTDSRGVLASMTHTPDGTRVAFKAADGEKGDTAITEANDGTRRGLSFDIVDATIDGDEITDGLVVAFGQCAIPAYDDARIDSVAAAAQNTGETMLTPEQSARLVELIARRDNGDTLTDDETTELDALQALAGLQSGTNEEPPVTAAAVPAVTAAATGPAITASTVPAVPGGVPQLGRSAARGATRTRPRGDQFWTPGDLAQFVETVVANAAGGADTITAALADVTHSAHTSIIEPPAWSGELWSGLQYEPLWSDLFTTGELTNWEGKGWRFVNKLVMQDYAGDKLAIPTSTVTTEPSEYEAARMAVGIDIDRKFYDFKNQANAAFLAGLAEQARESWAIKLDDKVRAYALAQAIAAEGTPAQPTLLKAAAVAIRALRRRKVLGRSASTWVMVNDDDLFTLMDYNQLTVPAFLELWGIDPNLFRSDQSVPAGTVLAGAKQAATVRQLPGSPLRFDAQNIVNGGVDEAFFGYWAIEEHHTSGIAKATYTAVP